MEAFYFLHNSICYQIFLWLVNNIFNEDSDIVRKYHVKCPVTETKIKHAGMDIALECKPFSSYNIVYVASQR